MKFTYGSGDRPLAGYTLKRGIGQGGFGEVYFAVSDGGKEVALKLLRGNSDIELRGVTQCLNLKHPNLVSLYDLKTDAQGDRWVVMEYVAGEPLSTVLARHPNGLAPELARQWFMALAKAVSCLHQSGIAHRDLKPGNIFLENGQIKVGDYGLSKFISGSQNHGQTQSIGTVHYMAPEISTGNYNKEIDIYAAGVILYEMLTGRVPFDGESAGEILMKHLTSPPDLSRLPQEYLPIVAKALAKNPVHRYRSMVDMARAVEAVGTEAPRAVPVARPRAVPVGAAEARPAAQAAARVPPPRPVEPAIPTVLPAETAREAVGQLSLSMMLSVLLALAGTTLVAAFGHSLGMARDLTGVGTIFFMTVAASWAVLAPAKVWSRQRGSSWPRRLVMLKMGVLVGVAWLWVRGWTPAPFGPVEAMPGAPRWTWPTGTNLAEAAAAISYFGLVFFLPRWWRFASPRRAHRFSLWPLLAAGFWAALPLVVWPELAAGAVAVALAAGIVQLVSPWDPPAPVPGRRLRLRYA